MNTETMDWSERASVPPPLPRAVTTPVEGAPLVDELLRDRSAFLSRLDDATQHAAIVRTSIATIVVAGAVFGASLGLARGGWQVLFAAVKLPLLLLLTAGISAPALAALRHCFNGRAQVRRDFALSVSALAFASLVLAGVSPVLALFALVGAEYHLVVLVSVGASAVGGLLGLSMLLSGLRKDGGVNAFVLLVSLGVFASVGAQLSWSLRPFLSRPRAEVTFLREVEGGFLDAVTTTFDSARGDYRREEAPLPSERW